MERDIQRAILVAWGSDPRLRLWRANTGMAQIKGRWVRFNVPGTPDLLGVYNMGAAFGDIAVAVGIEVKSERGQQSPEQRAFQRMFDRMGALYILARSVEDVSKQIAAFTMRAESNLATIS